LRHPPSRPDDLELLRRDIEDLHDYRALFRGLYEDPETVELLNATAPDFFHDLKVLLAREMVLGVTRLLDPGRGRERLTVESVLNQARLPHGEVKALRKTLVEMRKREGAAALRDIRNGRLAHRTRNAGQLPTRALTGLDDILRMLAEFYNRIRRNISGDGFGFSPPQVRPMSLESLLEVLEHGKDGQRKQTRG